MADDPRVGRYRAFMETDYGVNLAAGGPAIEPQQKIANALEYMAYQMGQINRNLARLVEFQEKAK